MKNALLITGILFVGQFNFLLSQTIDDGPPTTKFEMENPLESYLPTMNGLGFSGKIKSIEIRAHQASQISDEEYVIEEFVETQFKASVNIDGYIEWKAWKRAGSKRGLQSDAREDGLNMIEEFQFLRDSFGQIEQIIKTSTEAGRTVTENQYFTYDTLGRISEYEKSVNDRRPIDEIKYTYDKNDRIINKVVYRSGQLQQKMEISYADSIRVRTDSYDKYGVHTSIINSVYSERGLEYSQRRRAFGNILTRVVINKFDEFNRRMEQKTISFISKERTSVSKTHYEYEGNRNNPSQISKYSEGELSYTKSYSFNGHGQIIGVKENYFNGHEVTSIYKREEQGNVLEIYTRLQGQYEQDGCSVYKVEYYEE